MSIYKMKPKGPQKAPHDSLLVDQFKTLLDKGPVVGSPKMDGHRALVGENVFTASMKLHANAYVQGILARPEYFGLDGEIIVGFPYAVDEEDDVFKRTDGLLRRHEGEPEFTFYVFDNWFEYGNYYERWLKENSKYTKLPFIKVVKQTLLETPDDISNFLQECLNNGYEGAMIRSTLAPYKFGRCTLRELNIFKMKPNKDDEATVVDFLPQMENLNPQMVSELGTMKRSHCKANLAPKDTLGAFVLESSKWPKQFKCGTGRMNAARAKYIWDHKEEFRGELLTFKYQEVGSDGAPRQPIAKEFRSKADITKY